MTKLVGKLVLGVLVLLGVAVSTPAIFNALGLKKPTSDSIRRAVIELNSDFATQLNVAEQAVNDFRRRLNDLNRIWAKAETQLESHDAKIAEIQQGIDNETDRLRNIKTRLDNNEPIRHQDGRVLSEPEILTQIEMSIARKTALEGTRLEVLRQRDYITQQLAGVRDEMIHGPARLIELEGSLNLLKMAASFHRDRMAEIERNGSPGNLHTAYSAARGVLAESMAPFRSIPTSITPIEFPAESMASMREQSLHKVNAALGIFHETPQMFAAH